jgi:hypothetical protein
MILGVVAPNLVPSQAIPLRPDTSALPFVPVAGADQDLARFLGVFSATAACQAACESFVNMQASPVSGFRRCHAFAHFGKRYANTTMHGQCFGWLEAGGPSSQWRPADWGAATGVTSSTMAFAGGCSDDMDCSLNGECNKATRTCACTPAWGGPRCETLQLRPAAARAGLHTLEADGRNASSWGGSVLKIEDTFHMWASEMVNHCGIHAWATNSRVVHAASEAPDGPYTRLPPATTAAGAGAGGAGGAELFPPFAHEPDVIRAPTGELVVFYCGSGRKAPLPPSALCNCSDGSTSAADAAQHCAPPLPHPDPNSHSPTWMSWAPAPEGPWSEPQVRTCVWGVGAGCSVGRSRRGAQVDAVSVGVR